MRKIFALIFFPIPLWANYGFVQSLTCSAFAATVNCAYGTNPLAHHLLISACSAGGASAAAVAITDNNTNSYSNVGNVNGGFGNNTQKNDIYYAVDSHAGATTVTCASTGATFVTVAIHEYSGLANSSAFDVTSSSTPIVALAAYGSTAATTTSSNELMFGVLYASNGTESSVNGNLRENNLNNIRLISEDANVAMAGVYASSATLTTANAGVMMQAAFKLPQIANGGFNKARKLEMLEE
jgi:hypothetical protein